VRRTGPDRLGSMTPATHDFVDRLVADFPRLRPLREDYLAQSGEMLPHVFFGFVTEWLVDAYRADPHGGAGTMWRRLLDRLESEYRRADPDVEELLAAAFAENLPFPDEPGGAIVEHLGPALRADLETFR
jgi:hypothetical protein